MRKYSVTGKVMLYKNGKLDETWNAEDVVIAEDELFAREEFIDGITNEYCTADIDVDVDDINCTDMGPADIYISMRRDSYSKEMVDTMTVGELLTHLEQFSEDSKIYMVDFTGMTNMYGGVNEYGIGYIEK